MTIPTFTAFSSSSRPSPEHEATAIESIDPLKDVDGFHPLNVAKLFEGQPYLVPSTPAGILELLALHQVPIADSRGHHRRQHYRGQTHGPVYAAPPCRRHHLP